MEALGMLFVLGGILAFLITGLGYARKQQALVDCLKNKYNELWVQLGEPEFSPFMPFKALPLYELLASKGAALKVSSELIQLHSRARFWFFAFGLNFGVVFVGFFIVSASS